jgi:hypothetical protein
MTINKPLQYTLSAFFCLGAITLIGILSFHGALYLAPYLLGAAITSAALAMVVEGEIYKQNIVKGVGIALHLGKYLEVCNYRNTLKGFSTQPGNCTVFQDYHKLSKHLKKLQKHNQKLLNLGLVVSSEQRRALNRNAARIAETESRLAEIENFFFRYLNNQLVDNDNPTEQLLKEGLDNKIGDIKEATLRQLQAQIKKERTLLWASSPITLLGGIVATFVSAPLLVSALVYFGYTITTLAMCAFVWPLAALGGIGYIFMMYKTFVDIIHHKTLQKHWQSFKERYENAATETKILHVIGMSLLFTLAVVATICTAGTWWTAAKAGISLLPYIAAVGERVKNVITSVGVALLGLGHLTFDYANSLDSYQTLTSPLDLKVVPEGHQRNHVKSLSPAKQFLSILAYQVFHALGQWHEKSEQYAHPRAIRWNPFKLIMNMIEFPFRFLLILGHLISIGVTGDRLGNINPVITSTIGAAQEGMTDIHYFWNFGCHDHEHHDHHHSDIAGFLLNIILSPLKVLAAGWDSIFKKTTFANELRKEFGIKNPEAAPKGPPPTVEISAQWQHYEVDQEITNELKPFEKVDFTHNAAAWNKQQVFLDQRQQVRATAPRINVPAEYEAQNAKLNRIRPRNKQENLSKHRNAFFPSERRHHDYVSINSNERSQSPVNF